MGRRGHITQRQKQMILNLYEFFEKEWTQEKNNHICRERERGGERERERAFHYRLRSVVVILSIAGLGRK